MENTAELERWRTIRGLMEAVNGHLELMRTERTIGSSLEAYVEFAVDAETLGAFEGVIAQDVFRTSAAKLELDAAAKGVHSYKLINSGLAAGHKCNRCWKVLIEVDPVQQLCKRCEEVVANGGTK